MATLPTGITTFEYKTKEGKTLKYRVRYQHKTFKTKKYFDSLEEAKIYLADCKSIHGRTAITENERIKAIGRLMYGNPTFKTFLQRFYEHRYEKDLKDADGKPSYLKHKRNLTTKSFYKTICETKIELFYEGPSLEMAGFAMKIKDRLGTDKTSLGQLRPLEITYKHINAYVKARLDLGKKKSTVRKELSLISCFFDDAKHIPAVNNLLLPELNPCKAFDKKLLSDVYEGKLNRRINNDEWDGVLNAIYNVKNIEFCYILLLSLYTAMRRSEICNLKIENINNTCIVIPVAKKGKRRVYLTKMARDLLDIILEDKKEKTGKVFDMSISTFEKAYQRYSEKYKFNEISFHNFRKESISRAIEDIGTNPLILAEILGFKNVDQFKADYLQDVENTNTETEIKLKRVMESVGHKSLNTSKKHYFSFKDNE